MKKILTTILLMVVVLGVGGFLVPQVTNAQGILSGTPGLQLGAAAVSKIAKTAGVNNLITGWTQDAVLGFVAYLLNFVLSACAWFVSIAGVLLSLSINITTHVKDLYDSADGLKAVWLTVRDISSMVIIFALLYYSILTIVGQGGKRVNELIVSIFIAGVFINFSLFFARVGIDASNLLSLHIYEAIAPGTSQNLSVTQAFTNGGLSNVFMNALKLPLIYNSKVLGATDLYAGVGFAAIGGIILMLTTIFSFLAASLAFIARTGILLFCVAISPLYFAGLIFPAFKAKISDKIMKIFKGQLIFMPVYLFLLYIALRLISDPKFSQVFSPLVGSGSDTGFFGPVSIGVIIQYTIAIIFINTPLVVAISLSGTEGALMKWAPQADKIAGTFSSYIGRNSVGKWAGQIDKKLGNTVLGNSSLGRSVRENTVGVVASSKFLGSKSYKDKEKEDKEIKKKRREIDSLKTLKLAVASGNAQQIEDSLDKMSDNEIAGLDADILKDKNVVPHLSSNVYKNVDKSEKGDKDKLEIFAARTKALEDAVRSVNSAEIKKIMKNMTGDDLEKFLNKGPAGAAAAGMWTSNDFVAHLKPNQLKDMENVDETVRKKIGDLIYTWHNIPGNNNRKHAAYDFVDKNKTLWTT
jgi:hypothetical protein